MFVSHRTPDNELRSWLALGVFGTIVAGWVAGVALYYRLPASMFARGLWYAAKETPGIPALWVGPTTGLVLGVRVFVVCVRRYANQFGGAAFVTRLRGPRMVSQTLLASQTRKGRDQLRFAGIPIPKEVENTQFFVGGSTGTGKSVCISDYIESAVARQDRIICVDPDGASMRYFYAPGDVILNPFDKRSQGWSIFNEIRTSFDCEQYAISLIPRSPSTEQETWNSMGRTIVSETLTVLLRQGAGTTERLVYWLTTASNDDLKALLAGTPAAGCFHGAPDMLASIRTVLTQYITPHKYLPSGDFSFRDWLDAGKGSLWITWREDMLQALKPLISCWVDVTCASVLSMPEDPHRRMHLVCDELDSLEKLNYIIDAATKGRKKGLRIMPGVQSLAQLNDTYGKDDALTLRNCFRSAFLCGIGELGTYTVDLAPGDWVRISANDKALGVSNGERYQVGVVDATHVTLKGGEVGIKIDRRRPMHLQHGYASTIHSAQGLTKNRVLVDANTKSLTSNRAVFYVAISRPRNDITLFTDDASKLAAAMSREPKKFAALELRDSRNEANVLKTKVDRAAQVRLAAQVRMRPPPVQVAFHTLTMRR